MKLSIQNEYNTLKKVVVCWGDKFPAYEDYKSDDPEFLKFHPYSWDIKLLLTQQEFFFNLLKSYDVELIFPKTDESIIWQMYTRDTAFVINDKLFLSESRKFLERNGESEKLLQALELNENQIVRVDEKVEGGDVLVESSEMIFVGKSSRTTEAAIAELSKMIDTKTITLGDKVMHLDTRFTFLPNDVVLANLRDFDSETMEFLQNKYDVIEVTDQETAKLGTNVFIINPETVVVPLQFKRIAKEIENRGFKVETVDYTEPINLGGSFRCTTLPLERV